MMKIGEINMNLIRDEKEKELISKMAEEISLMRKEARHEGNIRESYFITGDELLTYETDGVVEYSPENPSDIETLLNMLWEKRKTPEMSSLNKVCTIAAMKNRNVRNITENNSISSVVYEF